MEIYTATLIVEKHLEWQNDKRNLPKVNEEKLKEATELLTDLVKKLTIPDFSQQRELLLSFAKHIEKAGYDGSCLTYEQELDEFLKANNYT